MNDDLTAKDTFRTATYGTGPYMYEGNNDGQTWNFVRNPNYWGEAPEVDSFSIKSIPDNDAKILALKNGEVDFISGIKNVSAESYDEISQTEGFGAQIDDKALQTYYVGYNLNDTVFGDSVIRKAIASAIDKDAVADSIYGGLHDRQTAFSPQTCRIVIWSFPQQPLILMRQIKCWMKLDMLIQTVTESGKRMGQIFRLLSCIKPALLRTITWLSTSAIKHRKLALN